MAILQPKFAKEVEIYDQIFNVEMHSGYLFRPDRYDNLPNISIIRRFPGKICVITY